MSSPRVLAYPDFEKPFVVETDASSVSVGAVLAPNKEDGKIHPIQYTGRTMNTSERKYYACEREALKFIFALKKCRVYLLASRPLKLVTDHQALSYAFRKKDIHGRLARRLDFLAENYFTVEYPIDDVYPHVEDRLMVLRCVPAMCYRKKHSLLRYEPGMENDLARLVLQEARIGAVLSGNKHPNVAQYLGCEVDESNRVVALC